MRPRRLVLGILIEPFLRSFFRGLRTPFFLSHGGADAGVCRLDRDRARLRLFRAANHYVCRFIFAFIRPKGTALDGNGTGVIDIFRRAG